MGLYYNNNGVLQPIAGSKAAAPLYNVIATSAKSSSKTGRQQLAELLPYFNALTSEQKKKSGLVLSNSLILVNCRADGEPCFYCSSPSAGAIALYNVRIYSNSSNNFIYAMEISTSGAITCIDRGPLTNIYDIELVVFN